MRKVLSIYKVSLFLSLVLSIVLIALDVVRDPLNIIFVFIGSFIGTFVLDLEYVIYAYVLEPTSSFSQSLVAFIKHRDVKNAVLYVEFHKGEIEDKTLNSALFQIVFSFFCIFVASSNASYFLKALVLSTFLNSIYKLSEIYYENKISEWFWALKNKPSKKGVILYGTVLVLIFIFCLNLV